ncbi:alpha-ketoglutarate-dependent dioxygenase AlkB [Sphingobium sp.]|uniref:alpha-ketoglutarate-dependent dioxygenase AlkB n=1 Tax=Sphingobium sp. TaxID=1912891 RepID=UPI002B766C6A|nr:alpha-ketoglutarate-dependent dioxygenase AlkB [Sphingobium sp.]HUD92876.1 alpha-ketoglutarate-dependent dioxygenase AlkB [Sphingobium sp.]
MPVLPGLVQRENFITRSEEEALIDAIADAGLTPFLFQQWTGKRLTKSFGWSYDFQTGVFAPAEPIPQWAVPLKARAARFAGLEPDELKQLLLIRYDPGAGIGWHRDRPAFEHVIGISLGEPAAMRFRRRTETGFGRANAPLAPRSIYHMCGQARHDWEHSITPVEALRWSITFRSLRKSAS